MLNLIGLPLLSVATVVLILGLVGRPDRGPARLLSVRPLVHRASQAWLSVVAGQR